MTTCIITGCGRRQMPERFYCRKHAPEELTDAENRRLSRRVADADAQAEAAAQDPASRGVSAIVCPHCQVRGRVEREHVRVKRGISGGKATGAVLTGGLSTLATGLSRKDWVNQMRCGNCGTYWTV
jgi:hypothetical protein